MVGFALGLVGFKMKGPQPTCLLPGVSVHSGSLCLQQQLMLLSRVVLVSTAPDRPWALQDRPCGLALTLQGSYGLPGAAWQKKKRQE